MLKQDCMNMKYKKEEKIKKELKTKTDIGWGHQIRSYVATLPTSKRPKKKQRIPIHQVFLMEISINLLKRE